MLDQESLLEKTLLHSIKDNIMHDYTTDESDETLSLCDLPLYSDHQSVEECQQEFPSAQSQGSSSSSINPSSRQDYFDFEFSSPSTTGFPPETIVFCGKLIPYKKQPEHHEDSSKLVETKLNPSSIKKKRGNWGILSGNWGILRWISSSSKNNQKSTTTLMHKDQSAKKMYNSINKHGKGYDHYPVHKMSLLTSSSSGKARWYYLFGISLSFSSHEDVQLRDIKSRRRHSPSPTTTTLSSGSGLSGLIRVLSCGGNHHHHPNTMVVASTRSYSRQK